MSDKTKKPKAPQEQEKKRTFSEASIRTRFQPGTSKTFGAFICKYCGVKTTAYNCDRRVFCSAACGKEWREENVMTRFLSFVQKGELCWLWIGWRDKDGYGRFWLNGKSIVATAASVRILKNIRVPAGTLCLHSCDNTSCVNPDHIFLGSQKDNIQDCLRKGRRDRVRPPLLRGEQNNHAILNREQVLEIRTIYSRGGMSKRELALRYGVSHGNIKQIIAGRTWAWLTNSEQNT